MSDQSADFGEEEVAYDEGTAQVAQAPISSGAGVAQQEVPGEIRHRRGEGRRINLRRDSSGSYSIWMRDRMIQSFCTEWEDVTRFQLPEGIQQQCRIHVQPMGEAREWNQEELRDRTQDEVAPDAPEPGIGRALRSIAHPQPSHDGEALIRMFQALPLHQREIIAGQIEVNYRTAMDQAQVEAAGINRAEGMAHIESIVEQLVMAIRRL